MGYARGNRKRKTKWLCLWVYTPLSKIHDEDGLRIKCRRIIAHSSVKDNTKIRRAFIGQKTHLTRNEDIDG